VFILIDQIFARFTGLAVACAFILACDGTNNPPPATTLEQFAEQLEALRSGAHIAGMSAAIASNGKVIWSRGFGEADVGQHIPASDSTAYHFASLTKTFASAILMQLVQQGKVDLEDPVSEYGITLAGSGTIRVKHLLTHTSGGTPGAQFAYNGDRFALLGEVIRHASGESFGRRVSEIILKPLGLRHTAPNVEDGINFPLAGLDRDHFVANLARGYANDGVMRLPYAPSFSAAAGLMGSAMDMARFSIAIDSGAFLPAATWTQVFTPATSTTGQPLPYGLGWFVSHERENVIAWHYGLWTASSALIIKVRSRNLTFVVLANTDALTAGTKLGSGDLLSAPVARLFLNAFVFGAAPLPQ
jgi:CubicO group peptidase (beta-lactamase class C family)